MDSSDNNKVLTLLRAMTADVDNFYTKQQTELSMMHQDMTERIEALRRSVRSFQQQGNGAAQSASTFSLLQQHRQRNANGAVGSVPSTPPRNKNPSALHAEDLSAEMSDWGNHQLHPNNLSNPDVLSTPPPNGQRRELTPTGSPQSIEKLPLEQLFSRLTQTSSNSPPINFETLYEQLTGDSPQQSAPPFTMQGGRQQQQQQQYSQQQEAVGGAVGAIGSARNAIPMDSLLGLHGQHQTRALQVANHQNNSSGRPKVVSIPGGHDDPKDLDIDPNARCHVLVEFKRKRVLQYESAHYVGPGEYVVVGGDRGEDIGLVIYAWVETLNGTVKGIGLTGSSLTRNIGVGSGTVLRLAKDLEVAQLHGVQAELERRAAECCMQRVLEHGLPMVIVDAEYQYDKKKLTFFYEAQQRMDFRDLVRDLFKTFRARIWMELVEN